jgi:hypothetical protein
MVVVDTNVLNCLPSAMRDGDFPRTNDANVRDEQLATFRLFLWEGLGSGGRVAVDEVAKHPYEDTWTTRTVRPARPTGADGSARCNWGHWKDRGHWKG